MSRAVSIRSQLKKYMQRFGLPLESCEGDAKRLRKCLVTGYWRNVARWSADGTYRSVRGDTVRLLCRPCSFARVHHIHLRSYMCTHILCSSRGSLVLVGSFSMKWKRPRRHSACEGHRRSILYADCLVLRIRILTEIEPDW
ncbi:hypothetical protein C8Q76DRAFT_459506 [Earliella scabrosa]|nr:hypothetical protein C8Q76DRAFT_459506 [Earliella scabrosa]